MNCEDFEKNAPNSITYGEDVQEDVSQDIDSNEGSSCDSEEFMAEEFEGF